VTTRAGLVRLAIRVRAADADVALARLLPVLSARAEERALGDAVEYALYGSPDALPAEAELRALAGDALIAVESSPVADGWETAWHAHLGRVEAGGFAIRPPWVPGEPDDLVIEPGTAFGAGGHPTTRLCLELLRGLTPSHAPSIVKGSDPGVGARRSQSTPLKGSDPMSGGDSRGQTPAVGQVCDWGTGSGVLAIAAARLGFGPVTAIDVDCAAVELARRNAAANGVEVSVACGDVRDAAPWAPTVVANLTLPLLEAVVTAEPPARMIASGFLDRQEFAPDGMVVRERRELDGWAAVVLEAA
jgi:ribosomal protein L11 methyltransferase